MTTKAIPRNTVTDRLRRNPVRSPRRIAHTANCPVNELRISRIVAGRTNGRNWRKYCSGGFVSGLIGGQIPPGALARTLKYAANRPAKNMTSLVRNSSIPRTGLPIPPRASCGSPATGLCSVVRAWLSAVIVVVRSVADAPVAGVEQGPLGADLGEPVEVVRRRR